MRGFHNSSFDPQTLIILETAFDEAWLTLKAVGNSTVRPDELARSVLRLAMEGERDPVRLHDGALRGLLPAASWRDAGGAGGKPAGAARDNQARNDQEWGISMATPAIAAAVSVPMSTAWTNGMDLRKRVASIAPARQSLKLIWRAAETPRQEAPAATNCEE